MHKLWITGLFLCTGMLLKAPEVNAHIVTFCGEQIPMDNEFVAQKLMDVIRHQIPNVNLPALRARALQYFPVVDAYLAKNGIPADFKYLPIVESGFAVQSSSRVGAHGFWQLMPPTAKELGLIMNGGIDEREDINKSSVAACKLLRSYYLTIYNRQKLTSWVLTAAAYNFGIGNILKAINTKGNNYFAMALNSETAVYVYKIIAVKELFEYPELYMKNFGYNVFSAEASKGRKAMGGDDRAPVFATASVRAAKAVKKQPPPVFVEARIVGKYKHFSDNDVVNFRLEQPLNTKRGGAVKGKKMGCRGWIIDDRVYVDVGYGLDVLLLDKDQQKGIPLASLKDGEPVLLRVENPNAEDGF